MSRQNRERKLINLHIKKEIIFKRESGKSVGDLSAKYGMAKSTINNFTLFLHLYFLFCIIFFAFKWLCWMVTLL